jgi:hypothetical protein
MLSGLQELYDSISKNKELQSILNTQYELRITNIETQLANNFDFTVVPDIIPEVTIPIVSVPEIVIDTVSASQYNALVKRFEILESQMVDQAKLLSKLKKELKK